MNPVHAGLIRDGEELSRHPTRRSSTARLGKTLALREAKARTHKRGRPSAGKHLFRKGLFEMRDMRGGHEPRSPIASGPIPQTRSIAA